MLDPEGQTIGRAIRDLGWEGVRDVRAGRLVHLRVSASDPDEAEEEVRRMCEELIANPVIEDFEVRVAETDPAAVSGGEGAAGGEAGGR